MLTVLSPLPLAIGTLGYLDRVGGGSTDSPLITTVRSPFFAQLRKPGSFPTYLHVSKSVSPGHCLHKLDFPSKLHEGVATVAAKGAHFRD